MIELEELSRIGFGCYRVASDSPAHHQAMRHALMSGCNLFDTATSYGGGASERSLGSVLAESGAPDAFVISKAGYAQGEDLDLLRGLVSLGLPENEVVAMPDGSRHTIHPDFLMHQITRSRTRLARERIDAFLLHNPEYYFDPPTSPHPREAYYQRIKRAFECLEESVAKRLIRYYGVSSNTLPSSLEEVNVTSLQELLRIAREISANHHFKLIQFPYNLVEGGASTPQQDGVSLIQLARRNGITTLANRPLNAKTPDGPIRIATYEAEIEDLDEVRDTAVLDRCVERMRARIRSLGLDDDPMDFQIVKFLSTSWMKLRNTDVVDEVFHRHFFPLLARLYQGERAADEMAAYGELYRRALCYSKRLMTERGRALRRELVERDAIAADDASSLSLIACRSYLASGIGHVLVGMRSTTYVDDLKTLFGPALAGP